MSKPTDGYMRLHWFFRGWKRGASGGQMTETEKALDGFELGFGAGQAAAGGVFESMRKAYGVTDDEIRSGIMRPDVSLPGTAYVRPIGGVDGKRISWGGNWVSAGDTIDSRCSTNHDRRTMHGDLWRCDNCGDAVREIKPEPVDVTCVHCGFIPCGFHNTNTGRCDKADIKTTGATERCQECVTVVPK